MKFGKWVSKILSVAIILLAIELLVATIREAPVGDTPHFIMLLVCLDIVWHGIEEKLDERES